MNRMILKNKEKRIKAKTIVILLIVFMIIYSFKTIVFNIGNYFLKSSEAKVVQITSAVINHSVNDDMLDDLNINQLYYVTKNSNNEIEMVDYNSVAVNKFLNNVTISVQKNLLELEKGNFELVGINNNIGGIVFYIPFGSITKNPIFNNIGPNIPVKIKTIGSILTNVRVDVKEYGINNCLIEMNINIEIKQQIILPIISKEIKISNSVPIAYKIINGKIPEYYSGSGLGKSSNIYSIPLE